jgi:formamidopyrimidine-DNA glycosylase
VPELPEVQTVVNTLAPRVTGKRIRHVTLLRPDMLKPAGLRLRSRLLGRQITSIERRAKRIVFTLDHADRFYIHLGMSGRLTLVNVSQELQKHTHLRIGISQKHELRFRDPRRFGCIVWLGDNEHDGSLGPEPMALRSKGLAGRLARTNRAIKTALLDQKLIAGLGNIYVDESLFEAGIHPATAANRLSAEQTSRLCRSIHSVLKRAIQKRGSSLRDFVDAKGRKGGFQKLHRVYGRGGRPCVRCGTSIQRIVLGGRSTHYCPACQCA